MTAETAINKIVLRLPKQGLRWIVSFDDLPIYEKGVRNFTIRVPFEGFDHGTTNARDISGPLIVFEQLITLVIVNNDEGTKLTTYQPANKVSDRNIELLKSYMRSITSSVERDCSDVVMAQLQK